MGQHEKDAIVSASWVHTFNSSTVLQMSPFYHYNQADYEPWVNDVPVATTSDRTSNYAGLQASITGQIARNTLQVGLYGFGQHDNDLFGAVFNDGSGTPPFLIGDTATGGVVEEYVSDSYKVLPWLTVIGGLRASHFTSDISETYVMPRIGVAIQVPKLNWVFRGFYGRFYQPPPLLTASGPIIDYAQANNTIVRSRCMESAMRSTSSACRFHSRAGCWMRIRFRRGLIIFLIIRALGSRVFTIR